MKVKLKVEIEFEDTGNMTKKDVMEYVHTAISRWGGQRHPDDVFFPNNIMSVSVKRYPRR